jgi:hypothetical protein
LRSQDISQPDLATQDIPKSRQLINGIRAQKTPEQMERWRPLACRPETMSVGNAAFARSAAVGEDYRGAGGQLDKKRDQQQGPADPN